MPPKRRNNKRNKTEDSPGSVAKKRNDAREKSNQKAAAKAKNKAFLQNALTSALQKNDVPNHSNSGHMFVAVKEVMSMTGSEIKGELCDPLDLSMSQQNNATLTEAALSSEPLASNETDGSLPGTPIRTSLNCSAQTPPPATQQPLSDEESPFPANIRKHKSTVICSPEPSEHVSAPGTPSSDPPVRTYSEAPAPPETPLSSTGRKRKRITGPPEISTPVSPVPTIGSQSRIPSPVLTTSGTQKDPSPRPTTSGTQKNPSPLPTTSKSQKHPSSVVPCATETSNPQIESPSGQQNSESYCELPTKMNASKTLKKTNKKLTRENAELKDLLVHAVAEAKKAREGNTANTTFSTDPEVQVSIEDLERINGISKSSGAFAQNLAMHLYGAETLRERSVKGMKSNRVKDGRPPKPPLTPTKLQFIYGRNAAHLCVKLGTRVVFFYFNWLSLI